MPSVDFDLTVVDNGAVPGTKFSLDLKDARYVGLSDNLGYARAANLGASLGSAPYIAILNSDVEFVNSQCVDRCVCFLDNNPKVGIVGPMQYRRSRRGGFEITHAGIFGPPFKRIDRGWMSNKLDHYRTDDRCEMVSGSAMFIRREAWNQVMNDAVFRSHWPHALGALPEHFLYYEDTTLCYAMPKFGWQVYYLGTEGAEMIHQWNQTIGRNMKALGASKAMFIDLMTDWGIDIS
jgi:GT2 family glycosyltransferase